MRSLCLLLLGSVLLGASAPKQIDIPIEKYQLKNGLRVVLSRDNTLPVVAVYLVYDIGARSEERGRTGFAHLFEHMMFEGSANVKKGEHMQYVESNGGTMNASTHSDYTDYFDILPSNKLPVALWLESDRMRSLAVTPENLKNQQEAVKQERRLSIDNQPYAKAITIDWPGFEFKNWQSSHPLIGTYEDLNAATIQDVQSFFKTFYAPNNAVLCIVGDIKPAETKTLIEQYFGEIPAQPQPKHPDLTEPGPQTARSTEVNDPLAKVPAVLIGYPGPPRGSDDYYAMGVLDLLLTGGDSSRLQLDLVKGKKSVIEYEASLGFPFGSFDDYKAPGDYTTLLIYRPDLKYGDLVDQYQAEVDKIAEHGVDPEEMRRGQALLAMWRLQQMETALGRARLLGTFELADHAPEEINTVLDRLAAVTPQQVQDVVKKYFRAEQRIVMGILPSTPKPEAKEKTGF